MLQLRDHSTLFAIHKNRAFSSLSLSLTKGSKPFSSHFLSLGRKDQRPCKSLEVVCMDFGKQNSVSPRSCSCHP
ncbi:hypothetical protein LOK49_LG06G03343 [Camellia lanceoleosa]|uniref:Uncharacterized protein n=1 Tax=Camellia lanceoleosa TaxID=1840588 RepID=A0ACC0HB92_9ERIC|nr:hypothetical protein LOK49_LG06G03343 [Camellia lanceoleosa]